MDPRYRFTIVVSLLLIGWWAYVVLSTFLMGERGLNLERYVQGISWVGLAALAGFVLVWTATQVVSWQKTRATGFEAGAVDEFGTVFEMAGSDGKLSPYKLALSKFLPQTIAPPSWPGVTPLEAELIGFLNGYRHWPMDLDNPETSLYEQAFARWQVMRHLPGAGPLHRAMALAKDLAIVHAYREIRTTYPLREFWKRDKVKFVRRCQPHGGITAFVMSTLPVFKQMSHTAESQEHARALLTALRYHETPALLPMNAGALARELVDYVWRAQAQLNQMNVESLDTLTPERTAELAATLRKNWLTVLVDVQPAEGPTMEADAVKMADGTVWLSQQVLLRQLAPLLDSDLRQLLRLWETEGGLNHPAWPHLYPLLIEANLIATAHDGMGATNGTFSLRLPDGVWGPVVKLVLDAERHLPILQQWQALGSYKGVLDVQMDTQQLATLVEGKARALDARLADLF